MSETLFYAIKESKNNISAGGLTPTSIGGEKQAGISGGSQSPADIASGRIAEVRSRSMSCNCMTRTSQQECRGILESEVEEYIKTSQEGK